jgi:hemoglobin
VCHDWRTLRLIGRDLATTHGGLHITESDWAVNIKHMTAALERAAISGRDKDEFLGLIESLRPQIVEPAKH